MAEVTDPSLQIFDHALWCPSCKEVLDGPCVRHGQIVEDQIILPRAHLSLPYNLEIRTDPSHQEPGVFARSKIEMLTMYGPLVAQEVTATEGGHFKYALLNEQGGITSIYDLTSDHLCNWMKFVRFAEDTDDVNTMAYQQGDGIYFTTTKELLPGAELKVWYSTRYSKALGRPSISSKPSTRSSRDSPTRSSSDLAGFDTVKVLIPKSAPFGVMAKLAKQRLLEFPQIQSLRVVHQPVHTSASRATHASSARSNNAASSQNNMSTPQQADASYEEDVSQEGSEDMLSEGTPNDNSQLVGGSQSSQTITLSGNKRYHTTYEGKDISEMTELEKKRKFNRDCQRRYRDRQKMRSVGLLEPKVGDSSTTEERSESIERKRQQACEATRLWRERQKSLKGLPAPTTPTSDGNTPDALRKAEIRKRMSESQRKRRALELALQLAKKNSPDGVAVVVDGQEVTEEMLEEAKLERKRKAARESVKRYREKKRHQSSAETDVDWRTVKADEQKNSAESAPEENHKDETENPEKVSEDEDAEEEDEEQDEEEEEEEEKEAEAEQPQPSKSSEVADSAAKAKVKEAANTPEETNASSLRRSARTRVAV